DARINQGDDDAKTILASASYKLPEGWWPWATADNPAGINLGLITGKEGDQTDSHSFYASADLPLPAGFGLGLVFDLQKNNGTDGSNGTGAFNQNGSDNVVVGAYLTKEISDKLDAVIRYEFADVPEYAADGAFLGGVTRTSTADNYTSTNEKGDKIHSITVGLSYDLWEDVITRIEYRLDNGVGLINHDTNTASHVIASVIYEF
ncbi:MAG: outer membrane beta-barrel protein, partial [Verrucomicrobiota bacterium]|nr:outer membrane beta-barrel protein [Verrucomicrobiota bacterium]